MSLKFFTINCLTIFPGALHQSDVWSQDWTGQNFRQEVLMRKCLCLRVRPTTTTRTPIMQRRSRCRTSGSKVTLSTRPQVQPRWGIDWEMRLNSLFSHFSSMLKLFRRATVEHAGCFYFLRGKFHPKNSWARRRRRPGFSCIDSHMTRSNLLLTWAMTYVMNKSLLSPFAFFSFL